MPFVNQIASDEDIVKYHLPFDRRSDFYWTRDAERNFYLWGGYYGNPAHGEDIEGRFHLYLDGTDLYFVLRPGPGSVEFSETPYIVGWQSIVYMKPSDLDASYKRKAIKALKDALTAYGRNGRDNKYTKDIQVKFDF
jgi:hypothetical protein